MFGICCYLHRVLHTAVKQRCSGSQAHNGTGLSAVSLHWLPTTTPLFLMEGVLLQNLFRVQKRHVSQGHNFHWGHGGRDLHLSPFPFFTQRRHLYSQALIDLYDGDLWPHISLNCIKSPSIRKYLQQKSHVISVIVQVYFKNLSPISIDLKTEMSSKTNLFLTVNCEFSSNFCLVIKLTIHLISVMWVARKKKSPFSFSGKIASFTDINWYVFWIALSPHLSLVQTEKYS